MAKFFFLAGAWRCQLTQYFHQFITNFEDVMLGLIDPVTLAVHVHGNNEMLTPLHFQIRFGYTFKIWTGSIQLSCGRISEARQMCARRSLVHDSFDTSRVQSLALQLPQGMHRKARV